MQVRSRRRRRALRVLVLLAALVVTGALSALLAPTPQSTADTGTSAQVAQGRALFAVGCASCHGLSGEGQTTDPSLGPPLIGVGAASVDFQVSTGRMPMARPGPQAPVKPTDYTEAEIAALAAYVATLGPGPAIPDPARYNTEGLGVDDLARGGELYRTNCAACHNFRGAGGALPEGRYAPALEGSSPRNVYQAMLTGPGQMPVFSDDVMRPEDKRAIIGYLESLQSQPDHGGLGLGGLGPVSEGLWAWIIGIGGLIAFAVWVTARVTRAS